MVAGLLFLAFAYLAVGQAAANRNGAQTAADAAALAAAQNRRDQLAAKWVEAVRDPTKWQDIFDGNADVAPSCWRAYQLAAQNEAHGTCESKGLLGFKVDVQTDKPVGDSVIPGTEHTYAKAHATAVIEALCMPKPAGADAGDGALPQLTCKDNRVWDLNPDDLTDLPGPEDLFDVHLAD